jgi:hypothetical protein
MAIKITKPTYLIYKDECLFVCMELIQIHISEPIRTKLRTHLPLGLEEVIGYVWTRNSWPLQPFRPSFFRGHCRIMGTRWLPARPFSAIPLYPWILKHVLVTSYGRSPAPPPRSSASAFRPLLLHVFVWRHAHDALARDNCAFFLCFSCHCVWCIENTEKTTTRTHVNLETWWHWGGGG